MDAIAGGPWYNATEFKAAGRAQTALEADVAAAHSMGLEYCAGYEA